MSSSSSASSSLSRLLVVISLVTFLVIIIALAADVAAFIVITVPSTGITLIGETYTDTVRLVGVLDQSASIYIQSCKFTGGGVAGGEGGSSLYILTTLQRGVSITVEGNEFAGGFAINPARSNVTECSRPVTNDALITVVLHKNVAFSYAAYSMWYLSFVVETLMVCGLDDGIGGFAGAEISITDNSVLLSDQSMTASHYAIRIYPAYDFPEYLSNSASSDSRRQYLTFARLNSLLVRGNVIMQSCRGACRAISVGYSTGTPEYIDGRTRMIVLPSSSAGVPVVRKFVIDNNTISAECDVVRAIKINDLGNRPEDDLLFANVSIELIFSNLKIGANSLRTTILEVLPNLPHFFIKRGGAPFGVIISGVHSDCQQFTAIDFIKAVSPRLVIEDSSFVAVGSGPANFLQVTCQPVSIDESCHIPIIVMRRNFANISAGSVSFYLLSIITNGTDAYAPYAPIDVALLGLDPNSMTGMILKEKLGAQVRRTISLLTFNITNGSSAPQWVFQDNVAHLRGTVAATIIAIGSVHAPPILFSGHNVFHCSLWNVVLPKPQDQIDIEAAMLALGVPSETFNFKQTRFFSASFSTLQNIILGDGGGACSSFNGRKIAAKFMEKQLALKSGGLAAVLGGTGLCADYRITARGCVWTQSRSLPRTKSPTLELTRTETRTLTRPPTRTATNTSIFVVLQNPLKEAGEIAAVIMAVAAVAAVLSIAVTPASALSVARMMAVLGVVQGLAENDCGGRPSDEPPDFVSSPMQINFGSSSGGFLLGTTVGNLLLLLIVTVACTLCHYAYLRWWKKAPPEEIPGVAKLLQESKTMPGLVVVLDIVLFPTLGAALVLVVRSEERVTVMVRLLSVVLAAAIVGSLSWWLWKMLFQRVRHERFQRKDATGENNTNISSIRSRREEDGGREEDEHEFGTSSPGPIAAWCAAAASYLTDGEGEWQMPSEREVQSMQRKRNSRRSRSNNNSNEDLDKAASIASITDKDRELFQQAVPLIEGYVDRAPRFMVMEFLTQLGLSLAMMLGEIVAERIGCMVQAGLILLALAAYLTMVVLWRPYQDRWSWVSTLALTVVEIITLSMALAGVPSVPFLAIAIILLASLQLVVALVSLAIWLLTIGYPALAAMLKRCKNRENDENDHDADEFSRFERRQNEQLRGTTRPQPASDRERRLLAATEDHRRRGGASRAENGRERGERGERRRDDEGDGEHRRRESSTRRSSNANNNRRRHARNDDDEDGQELLLQRRQTSSRINNGGGSSSPQHQQRHHRRHFELDSAQVNIFSPTSASSPSPPASSRRQPAAPSSPPTRGSYTLRRTGGGSRDTRASIL